MTGGAAMGTEPAGAAADQPPARPEDGRPDDPDTRPHERREAVVVRGHARDDELAALLAVLGRLGPSASAPAPEGFAAGWRRRRVAALRRRRD